MRRVNDLVICVLAVALAVLGGREAWPVVSAFGGQDGKSNAEALRRAVAQEPPFPGAERVTVLLIGADRRAGDSGRSDTLLVYFLDPTTGRSALLGIPRDLRVDVPGYGNTKINHAYAYGGPELSRETVEAALGIDVDYHAVCFFEGFVQAVDALGGVRVEVPDIEGEGRGMNYDDNAGDLHIHLKPGIQRLSGEQALGFVRYRKSNAPGLGDGDVGRSGRQQQLLRAVAEQHVNARGLPGLLAAARLVGRSIETDMAPSEMADLARAVRAGGAGSMVTYTLPLAPSSWKPGQPYYANADTESLRGTLKGIEKHLRGDTTDSPSSD